MIQTIQLLRNIGTFDSVTTGAQLPLNKFALLYAENSRGKTTLAAVLRSLSSGDALPILERKRLGADAPPHVVLSGEGGQNAVFQNSTWAGRFGDILVFDDHFVTENVLCGWLPHRISPVTRVREEAVSMADDIAQWLKGLGLGEYAEAFADNVIKFKNLPRLTEEDLKDLGLSFPPSKVVSC